MSNEIEKVHPSAVRRAIGQELARTTLEATDPNDESGASRYDTLIAKLMTSPDDRVRLELLKFLYEQAHGKAPVRSDTGNAPKNVQVRFDIGRHAPIKVSTVTTTAEDEEPVIDAETV